MRVADMACGTGEIALRLGKMGARVTGVDLAPEMIARAQEKARAWGVPAAFAVQDMRDFALPRRAEAVVCACDGVNLPAHAFGRGPLLCGGLCGRCAGGVFAFDISGPAKLRRMAGQMYGEDREDVTYLWMNEWSEEARTLRMSLAFFVREADGRYRRFDEEHVQRAHEVGELLAALARAGFAQGRALSGMTMEPAGAQDERIHFTARRPEA